MLDFDCSITKYQLTRCSVESVVCAGPQSYADAHFLWVGLLPETLQSIDNENDLSFICEASL